MRNWNCKLVTFFERAHDIIRNNKNDQEAWTHNTLWFCENSWNLSLSLWAEDPSKNSTLCCNLFRLFRKLYEMLSISEQISSSLKNNLFSSFKFECVALIQYEKYNQNNDSCLVSEKFKERFLEINKEFASLINEKLEVPDSVKNDMLYLEFCGFVFFDSEGAIRKIEELASKDDCASYLLSMASAAKEAQNVKVAIFALEKTLKQPITLNDGSFLLQAYRELIDIKLASKEYSMAEELIMKVQELLNNTAFVFPEIEVQWLLTKAWNTGVQFYSSLEFKLAESWCRLALSLVENLKTLKHNYQDQVLFLLHYNILYRLKRFFRLA